MEEGDNVTPFWLSDNRRQHRRRLRQPSSFFLNTGVLITLLLIIAFAFIFLIIPSFLSFTSKIFKPQLVKKSWDSLNLVLVLFAIICGFLSNTRSNNDDNDINTAPSTSPKQVDDHVDRESNGSTPSQWYDDRTAQRLRSSSSYPDLRQESSWTMNGGDDDQWRFYDDTPLSRRLYNTDTTKDIAVDTIRTSPPSSPPASRSLPPPPQLPKVVRRKPKEEVIFTHSLPSPRLPPPSPPPPPASRSEKRSSKSEKKAVKGTKVDHVDRESNGSTPSQWYDDPTACNSSQRLRSSSSYPDLRQESSWTMNGGDDDQWRFYDDTHLYNYRSRSRRQLDPPPPPPQASPSLPPTPQLPKVVRRKPKEEVIFTHSLPSPRLPPPPSQPSPPPPPPSASRSEKRSSKSEKKAGKGTKEFLISLRRKKKERQRSVENLDEFFKLSMLPTYPPPSPPPPPPPPPLPSFYQSIFPSKKNKARKHISIPPSPPSLLRSPQSPQSQFNTMVTIKINNMSNVEESVESGNESPINPIPPPPPPPPFKLRPWKFEVQGDYVRIKSTDNSRIDSPDSDDPLSGEASPSDGNRIGEMEGEDSLAGALFCPSPDVNTKADNFIARFRAGLTMEKINSSRVRSNLGPDSGPRTL